MVIYSNAQISYHPLCHILWSSLALKISLPFYSLTLIRPKLNLNIYCWFQTYIKLSKHCQTLYYFLT